MRRRLKLHDSEADIMSIENVDGAILKLGSTMATNTHSWAPPPARSAYRALRRAGPTAWYGD